MARKHMYKPGTDKLPGNIGQTMQVKGTEWKFGLIFFKK